MRGRGRQLGNRLPAPSGREILQSRIDEHFQEYQQNIFRRNGSLRGGTG
jgi:hypothetical protein